MHACSPFDDVASTIIICLFIHVHIIMRFSYLQTPGILNGSDIRTAAASAAVGLMQLNG